MSESWRYTGSILGRHEVSCVIKKYLKLYDNLFIESLTYCFDYNCQKLLFKYWKNIVVYRSWYLCSTRKIQINCIQPFKITALNKNRSHGSDVFLNKVLLCHFTRNSFNRFSSFLLNLSIQLDWIDVVIIELKIWELHLSKIKLTVDFSHLFADK